MTEMSSVFDGLFNSFYQDNNENITSSNNTLSSENIPTNNISKSENIPIDTISKIETIVPINNIPESKDKNEFTFLETPNIPKEQNIFNINSFVSELRENDAKKSKEYSLKNTNMSAYDIASGCIGKIVMKILNHPVEDYGSSWLPVLMRGYIGNSIHDFIQSESNQFTETERSLKIPSIHFSGRFDAIIGNNNLIEIKSCTYADYKKIIKNHQPRLNDFYQLMTYKYILENYLEEAQRQPRETLRSDPPKQREYNIDTIQFIFVCHQIFAADYDTMGQAINDVKLIKQMLGSKHNQFYFITSLVIDLTKLEIDQYINPIKQKIERINHYVSLNKLPDKDDEFINNKDCFFCLYKRNCPYR